MDLYTEHVLGIFLINDVYSARKKELRVSEIHLYN